jgi:hypothetical protein
MYCPKCGQQVSDNMRFCSRCGLPISEVADWLAGNGALAVREDAQVDVLSPRRRGMRHGAKIMFWGGILLPIFFGISIAVDGPFPLFIPFIIVLVGFSLWLYARLFGEETPSNRSKQMQDAISGTRTDNSALPPVSADVISSSNRRQVRTNELAQPPHSVTDHTTKLLDRE